MLQKLYKVYRRLTVVQHSPYENIYYCCTQKTASQWIKAIFQDPAVYKYTGLRVIPYVKLGLNYAQFTKPFPRRTIATHLYVSYPTYLTIPKPKSYKTFFIMRDPRDMVISWYFSAKYSHVLLHPIPQMRKDMEGMDLQAGLRYIIDKLEEFGSFAAQCSWMDAPEDIKVFRYEDLARDNRAFLREIFSYLHIPLPEKDFNALYAKYRFEKFTGGRKQGEENQHAHYRKGVADDWKNYFDESLTAYFKKKTGNLLEVLGYK